MQPGNIVRGLAIVLMAVAISWSTQPGANAAATGPTGPSPLVGEPTWQLRMLTAVNRLRVQAGVAPVQLCPPLTAAAATYARVMATRNHYGHRGPDGSEPWDRVAAQGYEWESVAENIAAGYGSVAAVMRAWRRSPTHLRNILSAGYEHVGFGRSTSRGSRYGTYWVQDFGGGGSCRSAG